MLNLDTVINVNVNIGNSIADSSTFDIGAILGPTVVANVLDPSNRYAEFDSLEAMAEAGIPATAPEYKAAAKYFGVNPAPRKLVVINYAITEGTEETPVTALNAAVVAGAEFYGVYYCPKANESEANIKTYTVGLVSALEALAKGVLFVGLTGTATAITADGGLLATLYGNESMRSLAVTCASEADDAAGLMGLAMGLSRKHKNGSFALCYKEVGSATVCNFTQAEVNAIKALNGNVYVSRMKGTSAVENGALASVVRFDEILYLDRIVYDMQRGCYALMASETRLPQNDSTTTLFLNVIDSVLEKYYAAGVLDTAVWRGAPQENVNTGDVIEHGHKSYADSFDLQSEENRAARKAMPITTLLCLSGSVESIVITMNVQT